jgi:Na+-transporting NADH:ubiquinone oxidoreductase subunit NqrB
MDPRLFQIFSLLSFLGIGAVMRDFSISFEQIALTFFAGISSQYFFIRRLNLSGIGYLSAIITCFGISLLLRSDSLWIHPLAACLAISAKFLVRINNKHLFNPANFGVLIPVLFLPSSWVSSGQWGSDIALSFLFVAFGTLVISRAKVGYISWVFLGSYLAFWAIYRVGYLGYEWSVWLHQLNSGTLLLFSFFMISDPKTTPNHNVARIAYAIFVAFLAHVFQYYFYLNNGILLALLAASPLVPLLDRILHANSFQWNYSTTSKITTATSKITTGEKCNENIKQIPSTQVFRSPAAT